MIMVVNLKDIDSDWEKLNLIDNFSKTGDK
jgi:hypothetical protein